MIASPHPTFLPHRRQLRKRGHWLAPLLASIACFVGFNPGTTAAQSPDRFESQRIDVSGAKPIRVRRSQPKSSSAPTRSTASSTDVSRVDPIDEAIQQAGFFDVAYGCDGGCGPVCDCGPVGVSCGVEGPACGIEGPGCGMETILGEPGCGADFCGAMGCDSAGCSGCDSCSPQSSAFHFDVPVLHITWQRMELFAGVQGFKGPLNYANTTANGNRAGDAGSFGFYEGFNEGRSLKWLSGWDMAWQFGARATQSNMSGTIFSGETRHQIFLTSGLFRRVDYGLQYGVAVDRLYGDWYYRANLTQIRSEISWKTMGCHVFGFQAMAGSGSDDATTSVRDEAGNVFAENITFEATDQYRLFYRQLLGTVGSWEAFGGWTDNDDALVGMSLDFPLSCRLTLNTGATYLNPAENDLVNGPQQEAWNISLGFTYRPGGNGRQNRYSRPMFDVADNGTFLIDRL